jgi:hypothetical protein
VPSGQNAQLAPIYGQTETCLVDVSHGLYFETAP